MSKTDWTRAEVAQIYEQPFNDLLFTAQTVHRQHFDPNTVQVSTLLSIKTGACPEDCGYCSQSNSYDTPLTPQKKLQIDGVLKAAQAAKDSGS